MGISLIDKKIAAGEKKCTELIDSFDEVVRRAVFSKDEKFLEPVPKQYQTPLFNLKNKIGRSLSTYFQLNSVISDTRKCYAMSRRYPWHGTDISKSDHFQFVWFNYTNQCYLFRERTKIFLNYLNDASIAFELEKHDVNKELKIIDKGLAEFIKHRGQYVHEWAENHISYRTFLTVEFLSNTFDEYREDVHNHYLESKWVMGLHMKRGLSFMANCFLELSPDPNATLTLLSKRYSTYFNASQKLL